MITNDKEHGAVGDNNLKPPNVGNKPVNNKHEMDDDDEDSLDPTILPSQNTKSGLIVEHAEFVSQLSKDETMIDDPC